ncbi:hypothetical protein WESB_1855 [Brachyspira pilosicoli WesB]|uniref:DUF4868 domain-containing protein n=1 Tax=Brachyspira pilosicoli WesB TaxID=1161918 RepID=K0JLK6_BRAPL|nr:hypothetical protein [Brachyspira pilosicoli]CCG57320.1 hypothetical protein WESB_1855 [Brachyspira pilosicoli WesB]
MKLLKFYAVKDNNSVEFHRRFFRIGLSKSALKELEQILDGQFNYFKNNKKPIKYSDDVEYSINEEEIFVVNNHNYIDNSKLFELFTNSVDTNKIREINEKSFATTKSFAFAVESDNKYYLLFQQFRKNYLFVNKKVLTYDNENFDYQKKYFIILPDYLSGCYSFEDNALFFRKTYEITSTIDLSCYYKEATDKEIKTELLSPNSIFKGDYEKLSQNKAKRIRKKLSLLIKNNIMEKAKTIPLSEIKDKAFEYGVMINVENDNIIIPDDKKELDDFISFFNDEMYQSIFGDAKYKASGKKKIITENNINKN